MSTSNIRTLWDRLYPGETKILDGLLKFIDEARTRSAGTGLQPFDETGAVYCLYPDAFDGGLDGAAARMDYFADLGIKTLWVLPALRSPGRDQGFDISDYRRVDERFGGTEAFLRFAAAAREQGLQIIFDVAVNHCSDRHPWFRAAVSDPESPYRDYFIWSDTDTRYAEAPLTFPGLADSNWTWNQEAGAYYFHRFYPFQADLNYANPAVTAEMIKILVEWRSAGVDGFRMDAAHMLWKQEGTNCENLPQVHLILKLFRAGLDALAPGSMLLAEANQSVEGMMQYFGAGDECRGAYHFVLMPKFWQALAEESPARLLKADIPPLPEGCAWYTYLRVHDEVTLEVLPEEERRALVAAWAGNEQRLFKNGNAFSGRLFDLLRHSPERTILAFHLLHALPGTPVLYYGDEIGMRDNRDYFLRTAAETGYADSRFLHRGPFDASRAARAVNDQTLPEGKIYRAVRELFRLRTAEPGLFALRPRLEAEGPALISRRSDGTRSLTIVANLSGRGVDSPVGRLAPYESRWKLAAVDAGN